MSSFQKAALGILFGYLFAMWVIWFVFHKIPRYREKKKVSKLRVGTIYVLDKANPFTSTRAVIDQICCGYVAYRYILLVRGEEVSSSIQSCKAESFASMYEEFAKP